MNDLGRVTKPVAMDWQPIATAPYDREVLVTGDSGFRSISRFVINAIRTRSYKSGAWRDATNIRLSDAGWEPKYWAPMPVLPKEGK